MAQSNIEQQVARYRDSLIKRSTMPPAPKKDKAELVKERLERTEVRTDELDTKRITLLLKGATLHAAQGQYDLVYALAAELAHMCRIKVSGISGTHPVNVSSWRAPSVPALESGEG